MFAKIKDFIKCETTPDPELPKTVEALPMVLSPKEIGYRWLWAYGYVWWSIKFRDLSYPELGAYGLCDYENRTIWIQKGMRNTVALDTMMHELAHVFTPGEDHSSIWHEWFEYIREKQLPPNNNRKMPVPQKVERHQDSGLLTGIFLGLLWR